MAVQSIAQATQTLNAGVGTLAQSYDTFLKLLTAQLKNQDPLSPMDNNQFTQQLTSMTGVQQQLLTNQLLTQMIGQGQSSIGSGAVGLIGKNVTVETNNQILGETGATWTYETAGAAKETKLEVLDADGKVVWQGLSDDNAKGEHTFTWDGKMLNGIPMPKDATYTLRITALDTKDTRIAAQGHITGIATRVQSLNGDTYLTVNGVKAPLSGVTSVEEVPDQPA